ncbi:MAG: helix-turn-helix transcriptional regulator [Clostridia bacterium]|nr:helix-turn-helix transcriptional regulator [Clostridia bacterium]
MFDIDDAGFDWAVPAGFSLDRTDGEFSTWIIAQYFGELELHVEGATFGQTTNTLLLLPPDTPHGYICHAPMSHNWLHVKGDFQPYLDRYGLKTHTLYKLSAVSDISELFHAIRRSYYGSEAYRMEYMRLKVEEILLQTALQAQRSQEVGHTRNSMLRELRNEILEHPDADWTISLMASKLYVSESYFFQLYRQYFGISPVQDVNLIRAERARSMLVTGLPLAHVAERCGYSSVYSFIRSFKRATGMTPGQCRRS